MTNKGILSACGLGLLVFLTFLPALKNDFVSLDDTEYVLANLHVQQGLKLEAVQWAFVTFYPANWHPLTWLSHMLDCQLFGLRPWGHHLTGILLHSANTGLLLLVLRALTGSFWRSLLVAALFGLHPLRVESVAWVAERKDVLSAFFFLLTLWSYSKFARHHQEAGISSTSRVRSSLTQPQSTGGASLWERCFGSGFPWYILTLVLFAFGLLSKSMLVTLPLVLLLLDFWPLARLARPVERSTRPRRFQANHPSLLRIVGEKVPFLCLSAAASTLTFLSARHGGAMETSPVFSSMVLRLENALVSYLRYLGKIFYPSNLAVFYPRPDHYSIVLVSACALALMAVSVIVFLKRRVQPHLFVGWAWFVGTLIPVIGLVQVGDQAMADRWTYIPSIGVFVLLAWALADVRKRFSLPRIPVAIASGLPVLACAALTIRQVGYWSDSGTLFRRAVDVTEQNYVAHKGYGDAIDAKGDAEGARHEYLEALKLYPDYPQAHINLGVLLKKEGKIDEAIGHYYQALATCPSSPTALNNLGNALLSKGNLDDAIVCYQKALASNPELAQAHANLGRGLFLRGRHREAIAQCLEALRLQPNLAVAYHNLGVALLAVGHTAEGIEGLEQALRLDPTLMSVHRDLATALAKQARWEQAIVHCREFLKLNPEDPETIGNLGAMLAGLGHFDEAIILLQKAVQLQPSDAEARVNLGTALAAQKKTEDARAEFEEALRLRPTFELARRRLDALVIPNPH